MTLKLIRRHEWHFALFVIAFFPTAVAAHALLQFRPTAGKDGRNDAKNGPKDSEMGKQINRQFSCPPQTVQRDDSHPTLNNS